MSEDWVERVREVMKRSLHAIDMSAPTVELDADFYKLCYDTAAFKGLIADGWMSLAPYLHVGVAMVQTSYAHLERMETRVWMALYTGFAAALDDTYTQVAADVISGFILRMTSGARQPYANLEHFAAHLRALPQHVDELRAGLFLTSTFNWITSLQIDRAMLDVAVPRAAARFAPWCGLMSGICEAYGMFVFPPEVPSQTLAPTIPDMMVVIRNVNDVFSFYKEERDGDAANQISLLAENRGISKLDALDAVANDAISAHQNICAALAEHPEALSAWQAFAKGHATFYYTTKRYRLVELDLE